MKASINIHNYEEYFLLYADGELPVEQMAAVEHFVKKHPELQPALDALMETRLNAADKIIFNDKNALLKTGGAAISTDNYEEYFLLYVDDELNAERKNETEKFVLQHPALQNEFTLLKQTRLPSEAVVFNEKEILFKKEGAEKPIVPIVWKRFAVAAVVVGLLFATWVFYPKGLGKTSQPETIAKTGVPSQNNATVNPPAKEINENKATENEVTGSNTQTIARSPKNKQLPELVLPATSVAAADAKTPDNNELAVEDVPEIHTREVAIVESNNNLQPVKIIKQLPDNRVVINTGAKTIIKETKAPGEENDNTLYVASVQINKNKIPNILKRARSILHFKGNDDNGIAIANFSISR
jgi:Predicted transmembrane transcriptional regulator (anti-sigma factor)